MRARKMIFALLSVTGSLFAVNAHAKTYSMTGVVSKLNADEIQITRSGEAFDFDRKSSALEVPKNVKLGDAVTIWYTMDAHRIQQSRSSQAPGAQPGQSGQEQKTPGTLQKDDRIYFDAQNSSDHTES